MSKPHSSASTANPPLSSAPDGALAVNVTWSRAARLALQSVSPDGQKSASVAQINRAVRRAIAACRVAPPLHAALSGLWNEMPPGGCEVDVRFASDEETAVLNRDYRHKDRPTDVLSFSLHEENDDLWITPFEGDVALGDIVIAVETAHRQAAARHHDMASEAAFLAVHGMLHLLGYDHVAAAERRLMWRRQEEICLALGLPTGS